jgi:hypothetical protein
LLFPSHAPSFNLRQSAGNKRISSVRRRFESGDDVEEVLVNATLAQRCNIPLMSSSRSSMFFSARYLPSSGSCS